MKNTINPIKYYVNTDGKICLPSNILGRECLLEVEVSSELRYRLDNLIHINPVNTQLYVVLENTDKSFNVRDNYALVDRFDPCRKPVFTKKILKKEYFGIGRFITQGNIIYGAAVERTINIPATKANLWSALVFIDSDYAFESFSSYSKEELLNLADDEGLLFDK